MNKLKLKIATQEYVIYFYLPEGEGIPGEISLNIVEDEALILSHAGADNSAGKYAFKAIKAIKGCVERKVFPLEFTQAWV